MAHQKLFYMYGMGRDNIPEVTFGQTPKYKWGEAMWISLSFISIFKLNQMFCNFSIIAPIYFYLFCVKKFAYIISHNLPNNSATLLYHYLQKKKWKLQEIKTTLATTREQSFKLKLPRATWTHCFPHFSLLKYHKSSA